MVRMEHILINFGRDFLKKSTSTACAIWKGFNSMASNNKNSKLSTKKIGTHSGMFHCDEALACFMLKQLPEYAEAEIVRTRDPKVLDECNILVDVGAVYNPKLNKFDHHQREFDETLNSVCPDLTKNKFNTIRLSSAGLIYAHFGMEVLSELLKKEQKNPTTECLKILFLYIYESFIEEIDAIDNGIPMYEGVKPRYSINTHLGARVNRINSAWNDPNPEHDDVLFRKAMQLVGSEFMENILQGYNVWWPARQIVKEAIENRTQNHESGEIIILNQICSWKDHLYALEEDLGIQGEIKFCIFHDRSGNSWRVQGIPLQSGSFICRVFLHKDWRGVRDEELSKIAKINNCIFCHASGFIGGNKTKDGAIEMALKSLKASQVARE